MHQVTKALLAHLLLKIVGFSQQENISYIRYMSPPSRVCKIHLHIKGEIHTTDPWNTSFHPNPLEIELVFLVCAPTNFTSLTNRTILH